MEVVCSLQTQHLSSLPLGKAQVHGRHFPSSLNMSAQTSPAEKGLDPGLLCQESYTYSGTDEAVLECDECCSLQCFHCEEQLHWQEHLRNHEQIRLKAGHVPYCDP